MMKKSAALLVPVMVAALSFGASAATIKAQSNVDMESENFGDATYAVGFKLDDVTDKEIFADIYDQMTYDIVDIGKLEEGDTIETADGDVKVETIERTDRSIEINGGYIDGGITLYNEEDTNGWVQIAYDLPVYRLVGQAQLTLGDEITLNIYKMKEDASPDGEGYDTTEIKPEELKGKLEEVSEKLSDEFVPEQMSVRLEEDKVTEVTLNYIP